MQGINAAFGDFSFDGGRGPDRAPRKIVSAAAALALVGSIGVWVLYMRPVAAPDIANPPSARSATASMAGPATGAAVNPYGEIVIDPSFLAEMKPASPAENLSPLASLDAVPPTPPAAFPLPSLDAFPPEPSAGVPQAQTVLPPPKPDAPDIGESAPLPPPRPPEFATPRRRRRHLAQPERRDRSPRRSGRQSQFSCRSFSGWGCRPRPPQRRGPPSHRRPPLRRGPPSHPVPPPRPGPRSAGTAPESRGPGRALLGAFPPPFGASAPGSGYDRYTAVYDISARTVYLPDGTRLEAHSGLGDRLDNPRYVSERMHGPTPPHVYELALREGSFHGVQALRLNPIGDGCGTCSVALDCSRIPSCWARTAIPTAACPSRTTRPSCAPMRTGNQAPGGRREPLAGYQPLLRLARTTVLSLSTLKPPWRLLAVRPSRPSEDAASLRRRPIGPPSRSIKRVAAAE